MQEHLGTKKSISRSAFLCEVGQCRTLLTKASCLLRHVVVAALGSQVSRNQAIYGLYPFTVHAFWARPCAHASEQREEPATLHVSFLVLTALVRFLHPLGEWRNSVSMKVTRPVLKSCRSNKKAEYRSWCGSQAQDLSVPQ